MRSRRSRRRQGRGCKAASERYGNRLIASSCALAPRRDNARGEAIIATRRPVPRGFRRCRVVRSSRYATGERLPPPASYRAVPAPRRTGPVALQFAKHDEPLAHLLRYALNITPKAVLHVATAGAGASASGVVAHVPEAQVAGPIAKR